MCGLCVWMMDAFLCSGIIKHIFTGHFSSNQENTTVAHLGER